MEHKKWNTNKNKTCALMVISVTILVIRDGKHRVDLVCIQRTNRVPFGRLEAISNYFILVNRRKLVSILSRHLCLSFSVFYSMHKSVSNVTSPAFLEINDVVQQLAFKTLYKDD